MKTELSSYFVRKKNPLVWLAALLLAASAALRIVYFAEKASAGVGAWLIQAVLPAFAAVLFIVLLFVCGQEALYKTITPVLLGVVGFFAQGLTMRVPAYGWMCCLYCLLLLMVYMQTMQGRIHTQFLLPVLYALPMGYLSMLLPRHWQSWAQWKACAGELSALGMLAGLLLAALATRKYYGSERRRHWGDRSDGRLVGMLDYRHTLTDFLLRYGGNIGYSIRPSERCKGYAKEMLRLALAECKAMGAKKVLITCDSGNAASQKVILSQGGCLENAVPDESGLGHSGTILRYWITL